MGIYFPYLCWMELGEVILEAQFYNPVEGLNPFSSGLNSEMGLFL